MFLNSQSVDWLQVRGVSFNVAKNCKIFGVVKTNHVFFMNSANIFNREWEGGRGYIGKKAHTFMSQ